MPKKLFFPPIQLSVASTSDFSPPKLYKLYRFCTFSVTTVPAHTSLDKNTSSSVDTAPKWFKVTRRAHTVTLLYRCYRCYIFPYWHCADPSHLTTDPQQKIIGLLRLQIVDGTSFATNHSPELQPASAPASSTELITPYSLRTVACAEGLIQTMKCCDSLM